MLTNNEINESIILERFKFFTILPREDYKNFTFLKSSLEISKVFVGKIHNEQLYGIFHTLNPSAYFFFFSELDLNLGKHILKQKSEVKMIFELEERIVAFKNNMTAN